MKRNANLFLAVGIVIAFIVAWDHFVVSRYGSKKNQMPSLKTEPTSQTTTNASAQTPSPTEILKLSPVSSKPTPSVSPSTVALELENVVVQMDSWGARISSWKVKEKDTWIDLALPSKDAKTLPLETYPNLNFALATTAVGQAVATAQHPDGFLIHKILRLQPTSQLSRVTLRFLNPNPNSVQVKTEFGWGEGLTKHGVAETDKAKHIEATLPEMSAIAWAGKLLKWKAGIIFGRTVDQINRGPFDWVGVANNHFLAAFVPVENTIPEMRVYADKKRPPSVFIPLQFQLEPGESREFVYDLYVGPKKMVDLKQLGHHLDGAVDFGSFGVISKGLLSALEFFRTATGNYGWAIVILTLCIQIVVFPLTKKSLQHSVKMKELQPQLKQLQTQFKQDPKRLQIETLNLYKKHGMHFMGLEGCLPILLQIPIFFAFYAALNGAYELRGAPWIFWIKDLAAPDPYYVLPILMGAGMFLQQKLTTVPTDPAQAKMMMIMPLFFVFMFFKMPAGLVLYWSINSVCTILSQRLLLLKAHVPASPAK